MNKSLRATLLSLALLSFTLPSQSRATVLISDLPAFQVKGGKGGHYAGGSGSSHKGGEYVSPKGSRYKKR